MKWFTRGFWLLAWSVWLYLGFGLYRELPRDLAPPIFHLPADDAVNPVGFLGDESLFVATVSRDRNEAALIQIWNARTGEKLPAFDGPVGAEGTEYDFTPMHSHFVGRKPPSAGGGEGLAALDIKTRKWVDLPPEAVGARVYHDKKPWAMFWEWPTGSDYGGAVFVFDLVSGREIFRWIGRTPRSNPRELHRLPFFIGDRIGIATRPLNLKADVPEPASCNLEVWSIGSANPDRVIKGLLVEDDAHASANGRVFWRNLSTLVDEDAIDVYDLNEERFVYSHPPRDERGRASEDDRTIRIRGHPGNTRLSKDGRMILWPDQGKIWDIDRGREFWSDRPNERFQTMDDKGRIEIVENWRVPELDFARGDTYAVREAPSGKLLYRTWKPTLSCRNVDESLFFDFDDDAMHPLPPRVNWPLLAICQSILALPLVLLWAVLRWRRRRKQAS